MRLLLDSHVLIWAVDNPRHLTSSVATVVKDPANELLVSAATAWEIAIKVSGNKLHLTRPYLQWMRQAFHCLQPTTFLPIALEHATAAANLPLHHRDPFDRMLA